VESAATPLKATVAMRREIMLLVSDFVHNWSSLDLPG
jgi:hypothetical protein